MIITINSKIMTSTLPTMVAAPAFRLHGSSKMAEIAARISREKKALEMEGLFHGTGRTPKGFLSPEVGEIITTNKKLYVTTVDKAIAYATGASTSSNNPNREVKDPIVIKFQPEEEAELGVSTFGISIWCFVPENKRVKILEIFRVSAEGQLVKYEKAPEEKTVQPEKAPSLTGRILSWFQ